MTEGDPFPSATRRAIVSTTSSAASAAAHPQAAPQSVPSPVASDRKVARKASVPRLPLGTAAAIRSAAAGPASAWVATSKASVAAGNGVSSPAHSAPAPSRRSVTRTRQTTGASALDATPFAGRPATGRLDPARGPPGPRRSATAIAAAAIAAAGGPDRRQPAQSRRDGRVAGQRHGQGPGEPMAAPQRMGVGRRQRDRRGQAQQRGVGHDDRRLGPAIAPAGDQCHGRRARQPEHQADPPRPRAPADLPQCAGPGEQEGGLHDEPAHRVTLRGAASAGAISVVRTRRGTASVPGGGRPRFMPGRLGFDIDAGTSGTFADPDEFLGRVKSEVWMTLGRTSSDISPVIGHWTGRPRTPPRIRRTRGPRPTMMKGVL